MSVYDEDDNIEIEVLDPDDEEGIVDDCDDCDQTG
jgi:hypothetical protein